MKILVLGWYYDRNLGDAVICDCAAFLLRQRYPEAEIVIRDMAGREAFPEIRDFSLENAKKARRRHRLRVLATRLGWDKKLVHESLCFGRNQERLERLAQTDCDRVIFAGGQLFMDSLALYVEFLTDRFTARGIPVSFNACGTGPSWSRELQRRLGRTLRTPLVGPVSCRDDVSLVNRWCGAKVAVPTADPALFAAEAYGIRNFPGQKPVGLGVMFAQTMPLGASRRFWRRLIRRLEQEGTPWKIFTNGSEGDLAFAREILASLPEIPDPEARLCPLPTSPAALVEALTQFDSLISFRLHSHILACSLDIPTVAITWDRKLPLFFEKIGCPERCLSPAARPETVLRTLNQARKTGYDRKKIDGLREDAANLLCAAPDPEPPVKRGTP